MAQHDSKTSVNTSTAADLAKHLTNFNADPALHAALVAALPGLAWDTEAHDWHLQEQAKDPTYNPTWIPTPGQCVREVELLFDNLTLDRLNHPLALLLGACVYIRSRIQPERDEQAADTAGLDPHWADYAAKQVRVCDAILQLVDKVESLVREAQQGPAEEYEGWYSGA